MTPGPMLPFGAWLRREIWLLQSEKPGDNAQMEVVAEALGWPVERRHLAMKEEWRFGKPRVRPSLDHVDLSRSDPLEPPGRTASSRSAAACPRWRCGCREQSGGRTRLVLIGKPRRRARDFDLIVASAQYRVPEGPGVVRLKLPIMRLDTAKLAQAEAAWKGRLGALPRPLTALLVGGPTKAVVFDAGVARELAAQCGALLERDGGSLYATTSRRTPEPVVEALAAALPSGTELHRFAPDAAENPYLGLLALADRFVVTSDSITMMVEVARLGKPLAVYALPPARGSGLRRFTRGRDLSAVPRELMASGPCRAAGRALPPARRPPGGRAGPRRGTHPVALASERSGVNDARPPGVGPLGTTSCDMFRASRPGMDP